MIESFTPRLDILPGAQRRLWPELQPIRQFGFVLYGGTAIALHLGHRQSVDFDFFNARPIDSAALRAALPFLQNTTVRQERPDTFEVETASGVRVALFGGLNFGRVGQPQQTSDGVMQVASLDYLMETKVKVQTSLSDLRTGGMTSRFDSPDFGGKSAGGATSAMALPLAGNDRDSGRGTGRVRIALFSVAGCLGPRRRGGPLTFVDIAHPHFDLFLARQSQPQFAAAAIRELQIAFVQILQHSLDDFAQLRGIVHRGHQMYF